MYTVVSLFSGAMGLDIGISRTNRFNLLACVEKEDVCCDTIRENVRIGNLDPHTRIYERDIRRLDPQDLLRDLDMSPGDVDLLIGGPPCQSFSTAGRRASVRDPRGTLLWDFIRFITVLKPKMFLMENVRGLMSAALNHRRMADRPDKGGSPLAPNEEPGSVVRLFACDLASVSGTPYHLDCFEVNAVNYGAPQLRERVLFFGNRYNQQVEFPLPTHGQLSKNGAAATMPLFPDGNATIRPWATLGDAIKSLNDEQEVLMDFSPRKKQYLAMVPPGANWRALRENVQQESMGKAYYAKGGRSGWWRRLSHNLPCPTLVTMPNHASTSLCHPDEIRALTVREYCRIQEFPDGWVVCGTPAQQYAQIGNAVPVRLGEIAGSVIAGCLDTLADRGWQPIPGQRRPYRRVYIQSHVRTRRWYKSGRAMRWNDSDKSSAPLDNFDPVDGDGDESRKEW